MQLEITPNLIIDTLKEVFPDHAYLIIKCIDRIVTISSERPELSTMGITKDGTLFINRDFWEEKVRHVDDLKSLLMHEMMHSVSGDTNLFANPKEDKEAQLKNMAANIAMDARINAYIVNTQPFNTSFFKNFYTDEVCGKDPINKLLRPSVKWGDSDDEKVLKPFHEGFYQSKDFNNHSDLYDVVLEILKKRDAGKKKIYVKLIGGHGAGGEEVSDEDLEGAEVIEIHVDELKKHKEGKGKGKDGQEGSSGGSVKEAIMDYLSEQSSMGAGYSKDLSTIILKTSACVTEKFDLERFKKFAFNRIFHNVRTQARVKVGRYTQSPLMPKRLAVTDYLMLAAGFPPSIWKANKWQSKFDKMLLPIYLDVSGSTMPYLPEIIQLLANVSDQLDYVWGFSNEVHLHTKDDLRNNKIKTTGGTDFDCIIEHVKKEGFKHIVVLTDGEANCRETTNKIPGLESVVTILFGGNCKENYFSKVYENTYDINEVKV